MTAPTSQRVRKSFLLAGAAVLLVLAVVLLVLLHGPARDGTGGVVSSTGAERRATEPSPSTTSRTPPLLPHAAAAARGQAPPPPSSGSGSGSGSPPPSVAHASAPPAIPTEIQNERDPKRKAELLKMHKLATARVRVSMLRHRANLLRIAIEKGRRDGSWSAEKVREAEASLRQLTTGIAGAQQDLDQVRTEVGGDIDRD